MKQNNETVSKKAEKLRLTDMLTKPENGQAACLGIFCFLSCLILPLSDRPTLSALYVLAAAVFFYLLTHSIRAMLYYALPAFLCYILAHLLPALSDPILLPTAFVALVLGGSCGGFLLIHYHDLKKYPYILAVPVAAYALSALITGAPLRGLLSLLPFALSVVAALCVLLLMKRTDATVLLTVTLAAVLLAAGLLTFAIMGLKGSPLEFVTETVRSGIVSLFKDMEARYAEVGMSLGLTEVTVSNTATLLVNLLPAIGIVACAVTAFLLYRLLLQFLIAFRSVPSLPVRLAGFTMSRISAVLFLAAYILSLFANYSTTTLFGTVCDNVALVLEPGLALVGVTALLPRGVAHSCLSTCLLMLVLILTFTNPLLGLALAAVIGAMRILLSRFLKFPDQGSKGVK